MNPQRIAVTMCRGRAEQALLRFFLARAGVALEVFEPDAPLGVLGLMNPELVLFDARSSPAQLEALREVVPGARLLQLRSPRDPASAVASAVLERPLSGAQLEEVVAPLVPAVLPKKRILVVDDDPDVLQLARKVLGGAGCAVTCVEDSRVLIENPPQEQFDLALLDVMMPGIDGLEICRLLRERHGDDLRICMMTAANEPEWVLLADGSGADGYLHKPLRCVDLLTLAGVAKRTMAERKLPPEPKKRSWPAAPVQKPRQRVLVVDDDGDILHYCQQVFGGAGVEVDTVQDAGKLSDEMPPGGSYELVLLDLYMPNADGIGLLRRFCQDVRNISSRFYVISADEDASLRAMARWSGADGYLRKPLHQDQLLSLLVAAA